MFLNLNLFKKPFKASAPSRNLTKFVNRLNLQIKHGSLSLRKKWKAGRADNGKIIIRTKSSFLLKKKMVKINYNLRYLSLGFISSFKFIPFKNKILSLIYFSTGAITYYLASEFHFLFSFIYFNKFKKFRKIKMRNTAFMLFQIKKLSFVSCLEILPGHGAQYCRSSGTKSKILSIDHDSHSVLIQLPSGVKKTFSYYSFVLLGQLRAHEHSKCLNYKAGYWRKFGVKPIVRGVAMNPVDHPHGGRTKAIRYQRTPWGHTTKFK